MDPSWDANATRWTRAVREGRIASRAAGTDDAIERAVAERAPASVLDVGCGEGWLLRTLRAAHPDLRCVGLDGADALIAAARAADPGGDYRVMDYAGFAAAAPGSLGAPFELVVFNFALFEAELTPVLAAARRALASDGTVLIQTLPPVADTAQGWRCEDFAGFDDGGWTPMRWYARTRAGWTHALQAAGLHMADTSEPCGPDGRPLSLLIAATPG